MVTNSVKYVAQKIAPNYKEFDYWVDLTEDPNGGIIKFWNGNTWDYLNRMDDQDRDIANEIERATAAEEQLQNNIDIEEQERVNKDNELEDAIDSIHIQKVNDLQYNLVVNDEIKGTVNIPEDKSLQSVTYNENTHVITLVYTTESGEQTTTIDLSDLLDDTNTTYQFQNGTNGSFTVTPSNGTAQTISVGKPSTAGTADVALSVAWENITGKPADYSLSVATDTQLGGVKSVNTGTTINRDYNVEVNVDGTMKVNVPWTDTTYQLVTTAEDGLMSSEDKVKLNSIEQNANNYILPIASLTQLGGVKIGTGIDLAEDGTISVTLDGSAADISAFTGVTTYQGADYTSIEFTRTNVLDGVQDTNVGSTIYTVDTTKAGLMSSADKIKLDKLTPDVATILDLVVTESTTIQDVANTLNTLLAALRNAGILITD